MTDALIQEWRLALLRKALPNVAFDGWTGKVLAAAAGEAGLDEGQTDLAFPNGVVDLICFFMAEGDRRLEDRLKSEDIAGMKVRARIAHALRTRIELDTPHREAVRRAGAVLALPTSGAAGLRALYHSVDSIWRAAGDTSTDLNFYTKRATLAAVYAATVLYWLSDESDDFADTWAFIDRRIDDVMQIEKAKKGLKKFARSLPDPVRLLGRLRYAGPWG